MVKKIIHTEIRIKKWNGSTLFRWRHLLKIESCTIYANFVVEENIEHFSGFFK